VAGSDASARSSAPSSREGRAAEGRASSEAAEGHPARSLAQAAVKIAQLDIRAGSNRLADLTPACEGFVSGEGDGLLSLFLPHATAGLLVMELGAGSEDDVNEALDRLLPRDDRWRHRHGTRGHGADHVLPLLASASLTIPVIDGRMALGTWQSIVMLDPNEDRRVRHLRLSFLAG
jgi:secondary thiamine-phosphate synthase enzyme